MEKQYIPGFDNLMHRYTEVMHVPYLNYLDQPYPTNDGNHITRLAAEQFSQRLAADIATLAK
ncbi:MAG: hypothetical protein EOO88_61000 [Pedobacter sp.]|nr:MAG: hypothetical protein EOO88_61000 [Pedobacter sp.]